MKRNRICSFVCLMAIAFAVWQIKFTMAAPGGGKGPKHPSGQQRKGSTPPARQRPKSTPTRKVNRPVKRSASLSAEKKMNSKRSRSASKSRRRTSMQSTRSTRSNAVTSRDRRLSREVKAKSIQASTRMNTAKSLARNSLASWSPDHAGQMAVLSSVGDLANKAARANFDAKMAKAQMAKRVSSGSSSSAQSSRGSSSVSKPARRTPVTRQQTPNTRELLKAISETKLAVKQSNTNHALSSHVGIELISGPAPGVSNAGLRSMRNAREVKTNQTIAQLNVAKGTIEAASNLK